MTPQDMRTVTQFLRKTESELKIDIFVELFGEDTGRMWNAFLSADYSIVLFLDMIGEPFRIIMWKYLSITYEIWKRQKELN